MPSHYLKRYSLSDQLHPWEQKMQENAFENVICKMAYILHLHQYVQSNLAKFGLSRTPISVVESFSNFKWRKIWRWYSRTLCKISKWFDNWIISYGKAIFHLIMGTHNAFWVYHVVIITYPWKKNNHPFILTGKFICLHFISATNTENHTVVNGQCGWIYVLITSRKFCYDAISTETC